MKFEDEGTGIFSYNDSKYVTHCDLIFEGEYLNGKRWNGKIYKEENIILYELKKEKLMVVEKSIYILKMII